MNTKRVEVYLGAYPNHHNKSKVVLDGMDITAQVEEIVIRGGVHDITRVTLKLVNVEVVGVLETEDVSDATPSA